MWRELNGQQIEWDEEVMMVGDLFFLMEPLIKTNCKFVKETFSELYKSINVN
mgnify:FL=1